MNVDKAAHIRLPIGFSLASVTRKNDIYTNRVALACTNMLYHIYAHRDLLMQCRCICHSESAELDIPRNP